MRKKGFTLNDRGFALYGKGFTLNDRGFTLLELIVVIFIVSLLAALVFPAFRTDAGKVKSDARKISSILRYLSDGSIAAKRTFSLKFNLDDDRVEWDGPEGKKKDSLDSLESVRLQSKGAVTEGELTVFSGPSGFEEYMEINLVEDEQALTVEFNPISGRAKIIEK